MYLYLQILPDQLFFEINSCFSIDQRSHNYFLYPRFYRGRAVRKEILRQK